MVEEAYTKKGKQGQNTVYTAVLREINQHITCLWHSDIAFSIVLNNHYQRLSPLLHKQHSNIRVKALSDDVRLAMLVGRTFSHNTCCAKHSTLPAF